MRRRVRTPVKIHRLPNPFYNPLYTSGSQILHAQRMATGFYSGMFQSSAAIHKQYVQGVMGSNLPPDFSWPTPLEATPLYFPTTFESQLLAVLAEARRYYEGRLDALKTAA